MRPDGGSIRIDGQSPGVYTKSIVSYLPDRMYFADWMRVSDMVRMFRDFYTDFRLETAEDMLERLEILRLRADEEPDPREQRKRSSWPWS